MTKVILNQKALSINGKLFKDNVPNYRLLSEKELLLYGPMVRHYKWPSKYEKPMRHQVITADFACRHKRFFIFNAIGTGKTLVIDWLTDFLQKEKVVHRALIVAPLSTLRSVHTDELKYSLPHLSYTILHGTKQKRLKELAKDKNIYIINFEGVKVIENALAKRSDIDLIFVDEVAILRNRSTDLWKTINRLFGAHTNKMVCGLTGSPMPKGPTDCYAQGLLIRPDNLPQQLNWRSRKQEPIPFYKFRYVVEYQKNEWLWLPKPGWESICHKILQPSIRFTTEECVDLPPTVVETYDVEMTEEQKIAYKDMTKKMRIEIAGQRIDAINEGVKLTKLLQITSGAVYGSDKSYKLNCKNKLRVLKEIIDASHPSHVLIFAPYRNILKYITDELNKIYGQKGKSCVGVGAAEFIDSNVPEKKRSEIYTDFTRGWLRFLVAIPSCMSHGLNLQAKCNVIIWWTPLIGRFDIYEQACGRIVRTGQTEKTLIAHLQSSLVERELYAKLKKREHAQGVLLKILEEK